MPKELSPELRPACQFGKFRLLPLLLRNQDTDTLKDDLAKLHGCLKLLWVSILTRNLKSHMTGLRGGYWGVLEIRVPFSVPEYYGTPIKEDLKGDPNLEN